MRDPPTVLPMLSILRSISSLLFGAALLLVGHGLIGTLLALRASQEGYADGTIGLIMSAYFVGFLGGTWVAPRVVVRIGHIRAFALFAAVASAAAIVHALIVDALAWAALRILVGGCLVGLYMVIESWLGAISPPERRGKVFAAYMIVTFLSLAAGQTLIRAYPVGGFELFGIVAMLFSLSLVPIALTRTAQPAPMQQPRIGLRRLYRASPLAMTGALGSGFALSAFWGLGPVTAQRLGMDETGIAALMSATILGGALVQWPVGYWSDRHDRRMVLAGVGAAASVVALSAFWISAWGPWPLLGAMFVFGGAAFTVYPLSVALANDSLPPEDLLQGSSSMLMINGFGAAIGPAVAGALMQATGPRGLMLHFAWIFALMSAVVWLRARRSGYAPPAQGHFAPMVRTTPTALEMIAPEPPPPDPVPEDAGHA